MFELGIPIGKPETIHGGLLHTMWCITTEKATYAIKQLSPNIDLQNKAIVKNYNLTEEIASRFSAQSRKTHTITNITSKISSVHDINQYPLNR